MKSNANITKKMLNDHMSWISSWGETGKLAEFNDWNLDNANLQIVDLSMAKFHHASLKNANLSGVNFFKAEIYYTNLKGANISKGNLGYSQCEGSNFADANLEGANFEGANLRKTNFTGANSIDETSFEKIYPINEKSPERNLKDNLISSPLLNETDSHKSGTRNQKSEKATSNIDTEIKSGKGRSLMDLNAVKPDMIEKSIGDLIDKLKSNIQFEQIKALCKDQHGLGKIDKIDITQGDIVIHDGELAFKFDCRISHNLSLLLDRKGKLININRSIEK
ncbi:MAG: pentapeptide repeat-containing protein [Flavobacteriaceae bacterium]